ncbi:MAG: hypothetical protein KY468_02655 [Armatimonadetes bacterium]|nr:hypothetical protein [Armatimonadota bacterium]
MAPLPARLWNALRQCLARWFSEEESGAEPHPDSLPAELEQLRRHAASLCAHASRSRMDLSDRLQEYDRWDAEARQLIQEKQEDEARILLARMEAEEEEIARLARAYESQRRVAETAVNACRRREAQWRKVREAHEASGRMEAAAVHAEAFQRVADLLVDSAAYTEDPEPLPNADPVAAARELLRRPPLTEENTS